MISVKGASFGRFGGWRRRYPGGSECRSIFLTVSRAMPNRLAASRWLRPSTWQASRTRRYRSTVYILPPAISKKIEAYRWQSSTPPAAGKSRRFRGLICHRRSHPRSACKIDPPERPAARLPRWVNRYPPRGFAPRSAGRYTKPRGSPLLTTGTTSAVPLRGVNFARRSGVNIESRLTSRVPGLSSSCPLEKLTTVPIPSRRSFPASLEPAEFRGVLHRFSSAREQTTIRRTTSTFITNAITPRVSKG